MEGRDLFKDKADVMVCDGFTGNVVLKVIEGFHDLLEDHGVDDPFLHRFNYENYGGLPVLGVNGNVIIGHGISNDIAIKSMVLATRDVVESRLSERIREAFPIASTSQPDLNGTGVPRPDLGNLTTA